MFNEQSNNCDSWWIILFLFAFCGWGDNGRNGGTTTREEIAYGFDNNQIQNGIRQLGNGICDSTYALNNAISEGNYKTINALTQGFSGLNATVNDSNYAQTMTAIQNFNSLQTQACSNTRSIIDTMNTNTRDILGAIQQGKIDAMQDKIADLQASNSRLTLAASQQAQNAYLIDQLKACPRPAYIVPSPYATQSCCGM